MTTLINFFKNVAVIDIVWFFGSGSVLYVLVARNIFPQKNILNFHDFHDFSKHANPQNQVRQPARLQNQLFSNGTFMKKS